MARYTRTYRKVEGAPDKESVEKVEKWQSPEAADSTSDAAPVVVDETPKPKRRTKKSNG